MKKATYERYYEIIEKRFPKVGEEIDNLVESPFYKKLTDNLERRSDVFCGGKKIGRDVSRMLTIRLGHIKQTIGDQAYLIQGPNTPKPRAGDVVIFTSKSGGSDIYPGTTGRISYVDKWYDECKKLGTEIYSFVGIKDSQLEKKSEPEHTIVLEEPGKPSWFYTIAATVQSPLPILVCEKLEKRGIKLSPEILAWKHGL